MRHVKIWWTNQHFWTMIGMAIFVVLSGKGVFTHISGAYMLALGGVVVSFIVFDELRDSRRNN